MTQENSQIPEMSLDELFASARAMGSTPEVTSLTVNFQLTGCEENRGTLTLSRNPTATHWLITVSIILGDRYHARIAQGHTADEAVDKIERYCHWWLGI